MIRHRLLVLLLLSGTLLSLILFHALTTAASQVPDNIVTLKSTADQWVVEVEILNSLAQQEEYAIELRLADNEAVEEAALGPGERSLYMRSIGKAETSAETLDIKVRRHSDDKETHVVYTLDH